MKPPIVSICIPAFKADRFLRETLETARAQTFTDWEMIVTEDGSRDRTEEIVREFAASVPQTVRYTRHEQNSGLPATRNTGIADARGTWIALLDSDDLWEPDHLQICLDRAEGTKAEFVHAGSVLFDSDTGREIELRVPSPDAIARFPLSLFCGGYIIQPSSVMLRRSLWQRVGGFDPTFRYVEDREMWIRCARAGAQFLFSGRNTCRYRKHGSALSRHAAAMALASARVYEKNADWEAMPRDLRRSHAADAWISAGRIVLKEDPRSAREFFGRALRHRSLAPATLAYWCAAQILSLSKGKTA